ncbi:MAG UNVERIFIED_CONTAM: hypothetical protein LVR18_49290 [Planctomycetaceae bacterium]
MNTKDENVLRHRDAGRAIRKVPDGVFDLPGTTSRTSCCRSLTGGTDRAGMRRILPG